MDVVKSDENQLMEDTVRLLLRQARSNIETDKADNALAALLHAVRLTQGEDAILGVLEQAKKQAELQAEEREQEDELELARRMSVLLTKDESTVLWERGEEGILKTPLKMEAALVSASYSFMII